MVVRILEGDALSVLRTLDGESVQCVVTSPPYFNLRDYGVDGQIGLESTPQAFLEALWAVFDEVRRVLRPDGLCFVNIGDSMSGSGKGPTGKNGLGDQEERQGFTGGRGASSLWVQRGDDPSYANHQRRSPGARGIPAKNLLLIPQRFAIGMQERGWYVRSQIAWCKKATMPESVRDRPTSAWEPIWMFSKAARYFYDAEAVRQPHSPNTHAYAKGGSFDRPGDQWPTWGLDGTQSMRGLDRATYRNPAGANLRNYWLLRESYEASAPQWTDEQRAYAERALAAWWEQLITERPEAPAAPYWLLGPEPSSLSHYASFPPEIPRRCILAGTSEKGACGQCGAPWSRIVERTSVRDLLAGKALSDGKNAEILALGQRNHALSFSNSHDTPQSPRVLTTGWAAVLRVRRWRPGALCRPGPVPRLGTTGARG
jgi:hypothetical protein